MEPAFQPEPQLSSVRADGSRLAMHPADVRGRFITRRRVVFAVLMAVYLAAPLVKVGGHPAVHLDVAARRFYLFGGTFNAQDFWMVLFLLTSVGFGLLFTTAFVGRAWCGWACPQTVFLEGLFRPVERFWDGPRERRLKLPSEPWTVRKALRALGKHASYGVLALLVSHTAVSLFVSAKDLALMVTEGPFAHPVPFTWAMVTTGLLYFNFTWFREQLCLIVCPYGRLQSAMHDPDSLTIGYDARRGEPRGKLFKQAGVEAPPRGDCVDCKRCIQVCPTAIDIRNGLQLDCLACAQCVDACDEVMDKVGRPRGLIRFESLRVLEGGARRTVRPRLFAYGALLLAAVGGLATTLVLRTPFEANLMRARGVPWVLDGTQVRNQFELHVVNKHPEAADFQVEVTSPVPAQVVVPVKKLHLGSLEEQRVPFFVTVERDAVKGPVELAVRVTDRRTGQVKPLAIRFLGPQTPRP